MKLGLNLGWRWSQGLDVDILVEEGEVAVQLFLWLGSVVLEVPTLR